MVEILVAMAIILILLGVVTVTGKMTRDSRKLASAQQQLSQISAAINEYATFWPAWNIGGVQHAIKGWPDFIAGRLFAPVGGIFNGPYTSVGTFNDYVDLNSPPAGADNINNENECLFYQLTSRSGKGPYFRTDGRDDVVVATTSTGLALSYPHFQAGSVGSEPRQRILDPWGTPWRYFWVYRYVPAGGLTAYRGYLPVPTADSSDIINFRTAVGYVLESAGPDKKFGYLWKTVPTTGYDPTTDPDIKDAADNLVISP